MRFNDSALNASCALYARIETGIWMIPRESEKKVIVYTPIPAIAALKCANSGERALLPSSQ